MNIWSKIGRMIDSEEKINRDYYADTESRRTREIMLGRIISILMEERDGIKAALIAERLGISKSLVNSIVYKMEEYEICKIGGDWTWKLV